MAIELSKLNEVQREAVKEIFGPCMIIAGAGSGKTIDVSSRAAQAKGAKSSPFQVKVGMTILIDPREVLISPPWNKAACSHSLG